MASAVVSSQSRRYDTQSAVRPYSVRCAAMGPFFLAQLPPRPRLDPPFPPATILVAFNVSRH